MAYDGDTPTWDEIIRAGARRVLSGAWWVLPVEVTAFDQDEGSVDLRPVIADVGDSGETVEIPEIKRCGIVWGSLSGSGYSAVRLIEAGETGVALFSSRSMAAWLTRGTPRTPPEGRRQGALTDALYIAGLWPLPSPPAALADIDTAGLKIGRDDGTARLEIRPDGTIVVEGSAILIGDLATAYAARADLVDTELGLIADALGTISAAVPVTNPYPAPTASVAATKTKVE